MQRPEDCGSPSRNDGKERSRFFAAATVCGLRHPVKIGEHGPFEIYLIPRPPAVTSTGARSAMDRMSRLTVVLSQAPGKHPAKRSLEESIVAALIMEPDLEVSVVPNLYDLGPDHTGRLFLGAVKGDMVVLSWLYPRAAFWLLDRDGIKGHFGETQLKPPADDDEDEDAEPRRRWRSPRRSGRPATIPDRHIYTLDLRDSNKHEALRRGGQAHRRGVPRPPRGEGPREGREQPRDRATRASLAKPEPDADGRAAGRVHPGGAARAGRAGGGIR